MRELIQTQDFPSPSPWDRPGSDQRDWLSGFWHGPRQASLYRQRAPDFKEEHATRYFAEPESRIPGQ